jgi:hypothetical protein
MSQRRRLARSIPFVLIVLLLASCSSSDEAADTTATTTTTEATTTTTTAASTTEQAVAGEVFEVMFDGVECEVNGPSQVVAGTYPFVITDVSGMEGADVRTMVIGEGYTYDDVLALQSEPGEYIRPPDWVELSPIAFVTFEGELQENQTVKTLDLEIATHAISVGTGSPSGIWVCGVLQVAGS